MKSLLARIGAFFVEPAATPEAPPPADDRPHIATISSAPANAVSLPHSFEPPSAVRRPISSAPPTASLSAPPSAAGVPASGQESSPVTAPSSAGLGAVMSAGVLGAPAAIVPVAAACAGELRARARASAALLCVWRPGAPAVGPESAVPAAQSPAGATTPGARRLAARLVAHGLSATACGRLAWLALEHDPTAAAAQVQRCLAIGGDPLVLAVAGARPPAFEPLLAELELAIAVLPADIDPALRELAVASLRSRERAVLPPLPPGPPRWAAMAGLARLRSLPRGMP